MAQGKIREQNFGSKKRITKTKSGFKTETVKKIGKRYYSGSGESKDLGLSARKADFNARLKAKNTPADSTTTAQFKKFKTK